MRIDSAQPSDFNTYWNYKRKKETQKRKKECKTYNEIENGIKDKGKYIDWRV